MPHRRFVLLAAGAAAVFGLTACGSSGSPGGPVSIPIPSPTTSSASTSPAPATSPVTSPVTSSIVSTVTSPVTSSPAADGLGCPTDATYCDTFGSSSGWPTENETNYFAGYDPYAGGSYRLGERTNATISEDAPVNVSTSDYSVRVDVDAVRHQGMPGADNEGVICWQHPAKSGGGTAAFLFFVNTARVEIGLWDGEDGSYHTIAQKQMSVLHTDGHTPDHIAAECVQTDAGAGLAIAVNGHLVLSKEYANGTTTYEWEPSNKVGLLASGEDSDVFYDNFAISTP